MKLRSGSFEKSARRDASWHFSDRGKLRDETYSLSRNVLPAACRNDLAVLGPATRIENDTIPPPEQM